MGTSGILGWLRSLGVWKLGSISTGTETENKNFGENVGDICRYLYRIRLGRKEISEIKGL